MALIRHGALVLAAALAAAGCARREAPRPAGRRVLEGEVLAMRASADGRHLAVLRECRPLRDRTLPPGAASCAVDVVDTAGGAPQRVADGVTTVGPGLAWSRTGRVLAVLAGQDLADGSGALVVWDGGAPRRLATDVTFHAFDRAGQRLAWIAGGQLFVAAADGSAPVAVAGADRVSTFELGRDAPVQVLARRSARAGGALLAVRDGAATPIASDVQQYGFSADGARYAYTSGAAASLVVAAADLRARPAPIGRDVLAFVFAPRGDALAFLADAAPGRQGDLHVVAGGAAPARWGARAGEPRWAADGRHLVWLQEYDPRSRTGQLAAGALGGRPEVLARNVSDFDVAPDGAAVAGLVHDTAAGYSVDLVLAAPGRERPPQKVARGVFGFSFSPDGRWLYFRTSCVREAEACDLLRVPASGLPEGARPERIGQGVKSFEFAPGRPDRLLLGWPRKDRVALDLALWEGGKTTAIDASALPGTAQFLGGDAGRLAYVSNDPKRPGAYVADVR